MNKRSFVLRQSASRLVCLLLLTLPGLFMTAQTLRNYQSKVYSPDNRPLPGASVENINKVLRTVSANDGAFAIQAATGDSLRISAAGFRTIIQLVPEIDLPKVILSKTDTLGLQIVQPVQRIYTSVPSFLNTASNDVVYSKDIIKSPVSSYRNAITGRLAGLYTTQSSGRPGSDEGGFSLRGQNPIVIIDGVVANITQFDLEEIESITVMKDAVGTAMMGVRGSNGAIVITTKKGKEEKQQISFTAQTAIQKAIGFPRTVGAYDYASLYNEALVNDGLAPVYTNADLEAYRTGSDPIGHPNIDWRNAITNKTSAFNRYTLSATGGNRFARYFVALDHINQAGFFKTVDSNSYNTNNNFKSYVIRSNIDVSITSKLTGGVYLLGRIQNGNEPGSTTGNILAAIANTPANAYPILNSNGTFGGTQQYQNNLYAQTVGSGYRQNYRRDILANIYLKRTLDEITQGLWIQGKASFYSSLSENIVRSKTFAVFQQNRLVNPPAYTQFGTNGTQVNTNGIDFQNRTDYEEVSIGYDRTFNKKHGVNAIALYNRDNYTVDSDLPYTITGGSARVSYNYNGKYLIEAVVGYNGSNRYPDNGYTKRGLFPAIGLGWNLDQEEFMKNQTWLTRLKIFGSYGKTGQDNAGYFTYIQRFFDASTAYFGTGAGTNTTITEQPLADSSITFEKAKKLNLGISGALFNNHLTFTAEVFKNKYYDLRIQRGRNTDLLGNTWPVENIGENQYQGFELQLGWQQAANKFQYYISGNASILASEVLYSDEVFRQYDWMKRTGRRVGQTFGYVSEGLYQTTAELTSHANIDGYSPKLGDLKYQDLNGDGVINQFDITAIGTEKPLMYYGLSFGASYKGFDFSALIQGVENRNINLGINSYWAFQPNGAGQVYTNNLNRWTPATAATATYPRLNVGTNNNNQAASSYWIVSGDYVRLKNAEIGYSLPASMIGKIKLQTVRVFINGYNLLTSSSDALYGRDPEIFLIGSYPIQRVFNFGLNVKF